MLAMKVVLVGPSNRFHGGISSYLEVIAEGLSKEGHEVGLILLDRLLPRFLYPGKNRLNDNPMLNFDAENIETMHVMNYYDLSISRKKVMRISDFEPDFAIVHWWTFAVYPMLSKVVRALNKIGCPIFMEMHEVIDQNDSRIPLVSSISRVLGNRLLGKTKNVVVHSEADRELVSTHFRISEAEVRVIPLANYSKFGSRMDKNEARVLLGISHRRVILFFGLIRKYKGVLNLIEAFEMMEEKDTLLMIVGEVWDERAEIKKRIEASPKRKDIVLYDRFVDDSEVSGIYSSADLLAMPYSRASQSAVSGVAMDFGVPIVAFSVGGLTEALSKYENANLVEPGNLASFSDAMQHSLDWQLCQPGGFDVSSVIGEWAKLGVEGEK